MFWWYNCPVYMSRRPQQALLRFSEEIPALSLLLNIQPVGAFQYKVYQS